MARRGQVKVFQQTDEVIFWKDAADWIGKVAARTAASSPGSAPFYQSNIYVRGRTLQSPTYPRHSLACICLPPSLLKGLELVLCGACAVGTSAASSTTCNAAL